MADYPKQVTVTSVDPGLGLYRQGLVQIEIVAIVPESEAQGILNHVGEVI